MLETKLKNQTWTCSHHPPVTCLQQRPTAASLRQPPPAAALVEIVIESRCQNNPSICLAIWHIVRESTWKPEPNKTATVCPHSSRAARQDIGTTSHHSVSWTLYIRKAITGLMDTWNWNHYLKVNNAFLLEPNDWILMALKRKVNSIQTESLTPKLTTPSFRYPLLASLGQELPERNTSLQNKNPQQCQTNVISLHEQEWEMTQPLLG